MVPDKCPHSAESIDFTSWIPIFPLPNVVLLPKVILPLHIFEHRYRIMTTDALSGPRLIAMALLHPGYEKNYNTLHADIHPTLCVGRILREERLEGDRYNILLQGLSRCTLLSENCDLKYRRAKLSPIAVTPIPVELECSYRAAFHRALAAPSLVDLASKAGWFELLNCRDLSFSELVDVLGSSLLPSIDEKQALLATADVARRAMRVSAALAVLAESMQSPAAFHSRRLRPWPPVFTTN